MGREIKKIFEKIGYPFRDYGLNYYLQRDYLSSILAITDKNGVFKEKRHFDAWGNIVKLTDGNNIALTNFVILDRGYTGIACPEPAEGSIYKALSWYT